MFQKNDDQMTSLKHSKSLPYEHSPGARMGEPPHTDPSKPIYRGKTPLNKSVYVEQAPGVLDIHTLSPNFYDVPNRAELLANFPHSPGPTEGLPRSGYLSRIRVQADSKPTPPFPGESRGAEATADQALGDILKTTDGHTPILGSSRQAERVRAKSSVGRSYTSAPPPSHPPAPTTHSPLPIILRSALGSRSYWPYGNYDAISNERDPKVIRRMINRYPIAPLCNERCPEHLRPLRFNMEDPLHFERTLGFYINMALAQGRPLDARADGHYHRIIDAGVPTGIVPETGSDWSRQGGHR
ncbi:hypothetical protein EDB19DRAFT_1900582 [Suillus lakei]|nr:hypothetical protein EDB19DRAFT_1900582 [Suillus lakei]